MATIGVEQDAEVLFFEEAKEFRATVERLDCLGQDSRGVQFPAKALPSEMAKPTMASWWRRKKVVRILVARKRARVVWRFPWQSVEEAAQLKVLMDADWSGDQRSREIGLELLSFQSESNGKREVCLERGCRGWFYSLDAKMEVHAENCG